MLQLQNHATLQPDGDELGALATAFETDAYVRLPQLIERSLLIEIQRLIHPHNFEERLTPGIGCVECCTDQAVENGMNALFNQPVVLETIGNIIKCELAFWGGNTVRRVPNKNHFSNWHNDRNPPMLGKDGARYERAVPLSVNLSAEPFEGGNLEIRNTKEKTLIADVPNKTPGDGILSGLPMNYSIGWRTSLAAAPAWSMWAGFTGKWPES